LLFCRPRDLGGNAGGLGGIATRGCRGVCSLRASSDRRVGQWWFGDLPGAAVYSARRDGGLIQKAFLAVGKWEMGVVTFSLSARPVFLFYGVFQKNVYSTARQGSTYATRLYRSTSLEGRGK
jgi:hypothetical protein